MSGTALIYDPVFLEHSAGYAHPEDSARLTAIINALKKPDFWPFLIHHRPDPAAENYILNNHTREYVNLVRNKVHAGALSLGFPDTGINSSSWDAAVTAVGAVIEGIDLVVQDKAKNAFCLVRPPGHHARNSMGMGFCVFNNIACGAWYAWEKFGIDRILIIDWDAHHGNGTQESFYEFNEVFFFSIHQDMWYPFTGKASETGEGEGKGTTMNFPLPAGTRGDLVVDIFQEKLVPVMESYRPDIVLISAGFDALKGDPLCRMGLKADDFAMLTRIAMDIADRYADGRIVSVLEGGYDLNGLARSCSYHVGELLKA